MLRDASGGRGPTEGIGRFILLLKSRNDSRLMLYTRSFCVSLGGQ